MHGTTTNRTTGVAHVTIFENRQGLLTKKAWVDANGKLASKPHTSLYDGTAITVEADTAADLARLIEGCKPDQALSLGVLLDVAPNVSLRIVTDGQAKAHPNGAIPRTQDHLGFLRAQPGWMLLDFDRDGMPAQVRARLKGVGGLWNLIVGELPDLAGATRVRRTSTLSGLSKNGVLFPDSGGEHVYIKVADAADIPRAIQVLKQRLMLAGLGWIKVSKSGRRLDRTVVDGSVGRAERLIFEGAPKLTPPLVQNRPRCEIHEGVAVDTVAAVPDLDVDEERELRRIVALLKAGVAGEAEAMRKANLREVAERRSKVTGEPADDIEKKLSSQGEDYLPLEWPIETDNFGTVTVADILADRTKFGGATCRDPLEPDRVNKAIIFDDCSGMFSHSHGGQKFRFGEKPDPKVVFADPPGVTRPQDSADAARSKLELAIGAFMHKAVFAAGEEQENQAALAGAAGVISRAARVFGPVEERGRNNFVEVSRPIGETPAETAVAFSDFGVGKTGVAIRVLAGWAKIGTDMHIFAPGAPGLGLRTAIVVQDHRLAAEVATRCNDLLPGMASVWRGTNAEDPTIAGRQMCRRSSEMAAWRRAGGEAASLCAGCPFNAKNGNPCAYVLQLCRTPVVVMAGPSALTHEPSRRLKRSVKMATRDGRVRTIKFPAFDMVIVDETKAQDLTGGFDPEPDIVEAAVVTGLVGRTIRPPTNPVTAKRQWKDTCQAVRQSLSSISRTTKKVLGSLPPGGRRPLKFRELRAMATEAEWYRLMRLLYALLIKPDPSIGKNTGDRFERALAPVGKWNAELLTLIRLCSVALQALECAVCGDVNAVPFIEAVEGKGLLLRWRKELSPAFSGRKPTLVLDATADEELLKVFWPELRVIAEGRAKLPDGVTVLAASDSLCGYKGWAPKPLGPNASATARNDRRRAMNNASRLMNLLDVLALVCQGEGGVGFIGPKALVGELERRWKARGAGRPPDLIIGHFGAIRGQDIFRDVRCLVVWSRPAAPPNEVAQLSGVLFGRKVVEISGWYDKGGVHVMRKGGCQTSAVGERHPDDDAEKVRKQITDAEVDQAIGRARAVRRSPMKPLLIIKGSAAPSQRLEIDELMEVDEILRFSEIDALTARGVEFDIFTNGKINKGVSELLAMAFGLTANAVRMRLRRTNSYRGFPLAVCSPEALFGLASPADDTKSHTNGGGGCESSKSAWRVKAKAGDRYWTKVWLRGPVTPDEAKALLMRENIAVASVEPAPGSKSNHRKSGTTSARGAFG